MSGFAAFHEFQNAAKPHKVPWPLPPESSNCHAPVIPHA